MLVLSAFDIALSLEPYEESEISLGFEFAMVDSHRDRERVASSTASSAQPTASRNKATKSNDKKTTSSNKKKNNSGGTFSSSSSSSSLEKDRKNLEREKEVEAGLYEEQVRRICNRILYS
jgi:hypothetical protein